MQTGIAARDITFVNVKRTMLMGRLGFFSTGLCIAAALVLAISFSFSQTDGSGVIPTTTGGSTTNFHFAEPNELTIVVNILGGVQRPGRYEISRSIDLMNLISLAGGTSEKGTLENVCLPKINMLKFGISNGSSFPGLICLKIISGLTSGG